MPNDQPRSESTLMDHVTFGGHSAEEVAALCELLAASADRGALPSFSETASIARRAADCIKYMIKRVP